MALNCLQKHRDIKITQCKHKVSHFYLNYFLHVSFRAIFEALKYSTSAPHVITVSMFVTKQLEGCCLHKHFLLPKRFKLSTWNRDSVCNITLQPRHREPGEGGKHYNIDNERFDRYFGRFHVVLAMR